MTSRIVFALASALLLGGCTIYGKEVRSMPAVGPEVAVVHACPGAPKIWYSPPSGGAICFSARGVEAEVKANNFETTFLALGPLLPLVPIHSGEKPVSSRPLGVDLAFRADVSYGFFPWRVSVQTAHGETIGVSEVLTNVRDFRFGGVHTVKLDPHDQEARLLSTQYARFFLRFGRPVLPDEEFSLTLHLIAPDGSDVQLPTITFKKGKLSYLGTIP
jgi:hypothetical protein